MNFSCVGVVQPMRAVARTISELLLTPHKSYYPMIWFEQLYAYALDI